MERMTEKATIMNRQAQVLVVDNDRDLAQVFAESLERAGFRTTVAISGSEGIRQISQNSFDVVVTDLMMNDVDGMAVLKKAKESLPNVEVIMITGHGNVPIAVEAMQQGAFHFLEKPVTPKVLQATAFRAAQAVELRAQNAYFEDRLDERYGFDNLIYASPSMHAVVERLKRIAPTDAGVLITGETGSGKDVIAQAIHQNSPRKKKPFVAINTAAVTEHLVESELFGHVKGAFTDAISDRQGKFEYADGGTLFLDEIGDMPMSTQIKLLRVLEDRQIVRIGDNKPINVNVRVLAATNKNLEQEIAAGRFRSDLYFRLKIVTVHLDPLSKRREDILPLADHFCKMAAKKNNKEIYGFAPELRRWLLEYHWRGNVRQLKNVVESLVVMNLDGTLGLDDLSPDLLDELPLESLGLSKPERITTTPPSSVPASNDNGDDAAADSSNPLLGKSFKEIERWAIENTLKLTNNRREETARILGISERNLYRKLKEYQLRDAD
ncbi:MAG: sigma-54-dependent Fis family transcriptional regulator [Pirellulaceae bacterium]|nr:sigma-54-dependent Fis family transcriptional regulator [Pirellulaceae bacterium]